MQLILPILASMHPVYEEPEQTQPDASKPACDKYPLQVGTVTFQLDEDLAIESHDRYRMTAVKGRCRLMISCCNWDELEADLASIGDVPTANTIMLLYLLTGDQDVAVNMGFVCHGG